MTSARVRAVAVRACASGPRGPRPENICLAVANRLMDSMIRIHSMIRFIFDEYSRSIVQMLRFYVYHSSSRLYYPSCTHVGKIYVMPN